MMKLYQSKILATGMYVPEKVLTNDDIAKFVDTNDAWIVERTGIKERRISNPEGGEFPTDMALKATHQALKKAGLTPNDIDLILFSSVTPDMKLPNSASLLQTKLGITNKCGCVDLAAACSGFVYGMTIANSMVQTGAAKVVLVIGSEMLSREINWSDRTLCILLGDGCGVALIGRTPEGEESKVLSATLGADGTGKDYFDQPIGGAVTPLTAEHLANGEHFMRMKGTEMFKVATRTLAQSAKHVIKEAGLTLEDVDWLVPHQANIRIIETTGQLLKIDPQKVIINIQKYGNTSAATVPMALHEAIEEGKIKRGDKVLLDAFGAGLTSGAVLFVY